MHDSRLRMFRIAGVAALIWAAGVKAQDSAWSQTIAEADCTSSKLGASIPVTAIGEPVSTVAERYPKDFDGIAANVPIVSFSSLMLAPALIRIQEKSAASWIRNGSCEQRT